MSSPAELWLAEQQFAKAVEMETIEFLCVPLVDSPGLAGIQ